MARSIKYIKDNISLFVDPTVNLKAHVLWSSISRPPYYAPALETPTGRETHVESCIFWPELLTRLYIFPCSYHYFLHLHRQISALRERKKIQTLLNDKYKHSLCLIAFFFPHSQGQFPTWRTLQLQHIVEAIHCLADPIPSPALKTLVVKIKPWDSLLLNRPDKNKPNLIVLQLITSCKSIIL